MAAILGSRERTGASVVEGNKAPGAPPTITVRRALQSDYPAIEIFLREAYGALAPFKIRQRWDWQFRNNPYATSSTGHVSVWIAEVSGKVIGQIGVQEGAVKVDEVEQSAGWVVDVILLPSYRGLGLGHQLYAAVAKECPFLVTLTMAPATRRMADNLGAIQLGVVKLYSRILRLDRRTTRRYIRFRTRYHKHISKFVEAVCTYGYADRILSRVGNLVLALRDAFVRLPQGTKKTRIVEIERFGPEIDNFWGEISGAFPVAFIRDSTFLNWRFCECPQMNYRCFLASRNESIVGYLVLRQALAIELPQGIIVDFLAAREDTETVEDLLRFSLEWFGTDVAGIECATSISAFVSVLQKFGFHPVRTERPNAVVSDSRLRERLDRSASDWLLSKADHDWDQIRPV
jgi:GNAT superfamily N-acetyltransferase